VILGIVHRIAIFLVQPAATPNRKLRQQARATGQNGQSASHTQCRLPIALRRMLLNVFADPKVVGTEQRVVDPAWQGKRAAVGAAYVVGWIAQFANGAVALPADLQIPQVKSELRAPSPGSTRLF
jgi:hypothetical protein